MSITVWRQMPHIQETRVAYSLLLPSVLACSILARLYQSLQGFKEGGCCLIIC